MMSWKISFFSKWNSAITDSNVHVRAHEVEAASGSAWVSDLSLCDPALEFAGALNSGSGCESGLPRRTSMTSPSTTMGFIVLRIPLISDVGEVPLLCWSRASPGCDCTCASSFACAPRLSRFLQASVLHSRRARHVHTILALHPPVCV